ncbi:MAG: hypothetical protein Q9166_000862 [cf. Caloplaca sp. 2 TL-2023]
MSVDIVDSHIHLYPGTEVRSLAWCHEGHPLDDQHSVLEYLEATGDLKKASNQKLRGFIFIETDRKNNLETEAGWDEPLRELDWIKRIADGKPRFGEGHEPQHADLCLGVVLWAPLPSGADAMQRYVQRVKDRAGKMWPLVKGFRYLVQDKPPRTVLGDGFIESLRWMGRNGFAFDLGVDARSGGLWQLREAVEMIDKAHHGLPEDQRVRIIIDHMCKPDMRSRDHNGKPATEPFEGWKEQMSRLASFSSVYVKVSGGFSEMEVLPSEVEQEGWGTPTREKLVQNMHMWADNWLKNILTIFGRQRMTFGSDWPVCNVGGGGNQVSWMNWWSIIDGFVSDNMNKEDLANFWSSNALRAYGI